MSRRKKKRPQAKYKDIELNIMPFIDVFSLLNTFLLMSAVFLAIGVLEVEIPFLTSAPPPPKEAERTLEVKVDMMKDKVEVVTSWTKPPINEDKKTFDVTEAGMLELHKHMVTVRKLDIESDKVQLFTEDDVLWKDMAGVIDAIKLRKDGDPIFASKTGSEAEKAMSAEFLYPKVILASVILR